MGYNDPELRRYIRSISDTLSCSPKAKKQIVSQIRDGVADYLMQNPDADFEMIQAHFGTPQEIAASYVDEQDATGLLKKMSIKKKVLVIVAGMMAVTLLLWIGSVTWATFKTKVITAGCIEVIAE